MTELNCDGCGAHVGWMAYAGPRGWVECDSCHECNKQKEEEE